MAFYTDCLCCVIHLNILRFSKSHFEEHVNFQSSFVHKCVFIWKLVFTTTFMHTDSVVHYMTK